MGRRQTPIEDKKRRGNPGKRAINEQAPQPEVGVGDPLSNLPLPAQIVWKDWAPVLEDMGFLTLADAVIFGQWCYAVARWKEATARGDDDTVWKVYKHVDQCGSKLGLSPTDRAKVVKAAGSTDGFQTFDLVKSS